MRLWFSRRRGKRYERILIFSIILVIILYNFYTHDPSSSLNSSSFFHSLGRSTSTTASKLKASLAIDNSKSRNANAQHIYSQLFRLFSKYKPTTQSLTNYKVDERIYHAAYEKPLEEPMFTETYLGQYLDLTNEEVISLSSSHQNLVRSLPNINTQDLYQGNGIVMVGGGKFNWLALLSIQHLRNNLNCSSPIEVIIPTLEEYEVELCDNIFPNLNTKCVILPKALGKDVTSMFQFRGYQYKALALLISSFENVLLLDSDNIPAHNPDYLFTSDPFLSYGLVVWPDFWRRATSPYYYKIAGIDVSTKRIRGDINNLNSIPLHDREGAIPDPTSESGQLLLSKATHSKTMFLSLYYNLFGPTHFYPLFSQGSDGEGDKETFLAAAVVVKENFYQVQKFLNALGYWDETDRTEFIGTGMGQYDPVADYNLFKHTMENKKLLNNKSTLKVDKPIGRKNEETLLIKEDQNLNSHKLVSREIEMEVDPKKQLLPVNSGSKTRSGGQTKSSAANTREGYNEQDLTEKNPLSAPGVLFIHANFPKLNPWELKTGKKLTTKSNVRRRLYGTGMTKLIGYDFELSTWTIMDELLCKKRIEVDTFKKVKRSDLCLEINEQLQHLYDTIPFME